LLSFFIGWSPPSTFECVAVSLALRGTSRLIQSKQAAEKLGISSNVGEKGPPAAKADIDFASFTRGLKPPPPSDETLSARCKAEAVFANHVRDESRTLQIRMFLSRL